MAAILTIPEIIEIGKVTTYLSPNYTSKRALFGGSVIKPTPPVQIAFVTDGLEWGYLGGAQTSASLRSTANYLYWLCGQFQLEAQNIINGPGGGSVIPPSPSTTTPNPYDFEVTPSSTPLADGESSVTLSSFIGYNVDFYRNGIAQNTTNIGASYYSWNKVTGLFEIFGAAITGEVFRIVPTL